MLILVNADKSSTHAPKSGLAMEHSLNHGDTLT